jgi:hypothetical protein
MTQASAIALFNADQYPDNVDVGGDQVPGNYTPARYNDADIEAAQVAPPSFLNIHPQVVNKIATERNAIAPTPGQEITLATEPVQIVSQGQSPQLPAENILNFGWLWMI